MEKDGSGPDSIRPGVFFTLSAPTDTDPCLHDWPTAVCLEAARFEEDGVRSDDHSFTRPLPLHGLTGKEQHDFSPAHFARSWRTSGLS
jgi:hypothetical protein